MYLNKPFIKFTLQQFLDSGFHVGSTLLTHYTVTYLIGERKNVFLFDLEQSLFLLKKALSFLKSITFKGGKVFFLCISPSRSVQRFTYLLAKQCYQPCYAKNRWEGGVLSNWKNITVSRIKNFVYSKKKGRLNMTKVEKRKRQSLFYFYNSLIVKTAASKLSTFFHKKVKKKRLLLKFPDAVYVYNPLNISHIYHECYHIGIPMVGIVDSDVSFSSYFQYPIPGNDDSMVSYRLITYLIAYSCLRGIQEKRVAFWKTIK